MITFTNRVGVAPGTTTVALRGLGVQCEPIPGPLTVEPLHVRPSPGPLPPAQQPDAGMRVVAFDPYEEPTTMKGLGIVLNPAGVARRLPDTLGPYEDPDDPYYNQAESVGYYHDTQLGALPTDFDLATDRCYTPVQSGWIDIPKDDGLQGTAQPRGLAGALGDATAAVDELTAANKRTFWLGVVSTSAVVALAAINIFRTWKGK